MPRTLTFTRIPRQDGYGDCWYCSEVVVDPVRYRVEGHVDGPVTICVCRKRRCMERVDAESLEPAE